MYVVQMRSGFVLQMKQLAPFLEGGREKHRDGFQAMLNCNNTVGSVGRTGLVELICLPVRQLQLKWLYIPGRSALPMRLASSKFK